MKKLHFKYSAMNAGKSMHLIMTYYNYKELGLNPVAVVPDHVTKCEIESRTGARIPAIRFGTLKEKIKKEKIDCILVDEVQFLDKEGIILLSEISVKDDIQVICYGLRTTSLGEPFKASEYLLAIADILEELPTLCSCGSKARMNIRIIDGKIDKSKEIVKLKENKNIEYKSVCRACFFELMNNESIEDKTFLQVTRVLSAENLSYNNETYFRTREIAAILGVKQPFEMVANIRRNLGVKSIVQGEKSKTFRTVDDDDRTTFVSAKYLKRFLTNGTINHKMINAKREELIRALEFYK